jgi:hypothetical protein
MVESVGFRVQGLGFEFQVQGSEARSKELEVVVQRYWAYKFGDFRDFIG